jgi:hypothetical protein
VLTITRRNRNRKRKGEDGGWRAKKEGKPKHSDAIQMPFKSMHIKENGLEKRKNGGSRPCKYREDLHIRRGTREVTVKQTDNNIFMMYYYYTNS